MYNMRQMFGGDPKGKLHMLLEYIGSQNDIADPWYTHDYETTQREVIAGCKGLLDHLIKYKRGE